MTHWIKKIEWEFGEPYGHVYYPIDTEDSRKKINELDVQASTSGKPFYTELYFEDDSYVGLIVGHELSAFMFAIFASDDFDSNTCRTKLDTHYDRQKVHDPTTIQYSYKGDHGEKHIAEMVSKQQAFAAVDHYLEHGTFPSYILFTRQEFIDTYRA